MSPCCRVYKLNKDKPSLNSYGVYLEGGSNRQAGFTRATEGWQGMRIPAAYQHVRALLQHLGLYAAQPGSEQHLTIPFTCRSPSAASRLRWRAHRPGCSALPMPWCTQSPWPSTAHTGTNGCW